MLSDMGVMINRRRMFGGKKLPYDYEVEYLESTGTQNIDTGVQATLYTSAKIKFINTEFTGVAILGGGDNGDKQDWRFFNYQNKAYMDVGNGRVFGGSVAPNNLYELEVGNLYVYNLQTQTYIVRGNSATGTPNTHIYINGYTALFSKNKFYYVQLFEGNVLVRDFIPVVKDGVGYMYDKVSGTLFGNAGTGSFIVGPRVS